MRHLKKTKIFERNGTSVHITYFKDTSMNKSSYLIRLYKSTALAMNVLNFNKH